MSYMRQMAQYVTVEQKESSSTKVSNPTRIQVGNVYIQATNVTRMVKKTIGGQEQKVKELQDEKLWKFHIVYIALHASNGDMISGFSCNTMRLLEILDEGIFSPKTTKNIGDAFEQYCSKFATNGRKVIIAKL